MDGTARSAAGFAERRSAGLTISQERFTVHQKNPKPLEWKIPIAWRDVRAYRHFPRVFLLEQKSATLAGAQPARS